MEVGVAAVTIEAIAARAGVGKQTIYRWWPTKGAVVFEAVLDGAAAGERADAALPDTGDLAADLRIVLRGIVDELSDPATDRLQRTVAAEVQADDALAGELVVRLLGPQLAATVARLQSAQRAGEVSAAADLELVAEMFFAPIFYRWFLRLGPLDHRYADRVVAQVLAGLAAG